jgi:DNA primase
MNIKDLIESDGVKLKKYGATYRGRCPFHNGKTETSLLVDAEAGKYHCFGCDNHGDAIQWLRERWGLSFLEACDYLGHDPGPRKEVRPTPAALEPKEAKTPSELWQSKARIFLDEAIKTLWTPMGDKTRAWLHAEKGLNYATIKAACLGLNLADIYEPRAAWGLDPIIKDDGTEQRQWIPSGLVIPLIKNKKIMRLRIRRTDPGDGPRYVVISGASPAPLISGKDKTAFVIVESELDGLLLSQDAGDICGIIALGTVKAKPDKQTHELLKTAPVILISLDTDNAGASASWKFWPDTYGAKAKRWPTIKGKDASEARLNGLDLRGWIIAGMFESEEKFERFCIQTLDGGLTDVEALKEMTNELKRGGSGQNMTNQGVANDTE